MNPEDFRIKESYTVEGITADFVWYEATIIREGLTAAMNRFEKVVSVMEARHKEHQKMIQQLWDENRALKAVIDATNLASDPKGLKLRKKK